MRAATGKDKERPKVEAAEWSRLIGLALKWLQADLAIWTSQAKDSMRRREVRDQLTNWKNESDLAPIRDPAALAAMPPDDRKQKFLDRIEEWLDQMRAANPFAAMMEEGMGGVFGNIFGGPLDEYDDDEEFEDDDEW